VRVASLEDVPEITPLFRQYLAFYSRHATATLPSTFLAARLSAGDCRILVAVRSRRPENVLGFALNYPSYSSLRMAKIWILNDLFVAPDHRRRGVARRLIEAVDEHARADGASAVRLETEAANHRARQLYQAAGYRADTTFLTYCRELFDPD
jgi:GNAT superfamily N-acetyltransferase